jgi:crossover junction endodeoxyribonuclease RusA
VKRPDLDKLVRGVFDALTGVCFTDDSRIVALQAGKRIAEIGEGPGVNITIRELS